MLSSDFKIYKFTHTPDRGDLVYRYFIARSIGEAITLCNKAYEQYWPVTPQPEWVITSHDIDNCTLCFTYALNVKP